MLNLIWNPAARQDVHEITAYISKRDPDAAERIGQLIQAGAERSASHPYAHRPGRAPGTREAVVHPNYIVIYEVRLDEIEIMAVIHSHREYPPIE